MNDIFVSFVIPVLDGTYLEECIESIWQQVGIDNSEVIIVNNGTRKNTKEAIKSLKKNGSVIELHCKKRGPAAARNMGVDNARGKYLAFIDADVILEKDWAITLIKGMDGFYDMAAASVIPSARDNNQNSFLNRYRYKFRKESTLGTFITSFGHMNEGCISPAVNTAACIVNRASFLTLNKFDERFKRAEDLEFSRRAYSHGFSFYFTDKTNAKVFFSGGVLNYCLRSLKDGYYMALVRVTKPVELFTILNPFGLLSNLNFKESMFHFFLSSCRFVGGCLIFFKLRGQAQHVRKRYHFRYHSKHKLQVFSYQGSIYSLNGWSRFLCFDFRDSSKVCLKTYYGQSFISKTELPMSTFKKILCGKVEETDLIGMEFSREIFYHKLVPAGKALNGEKHGY